MPERDENARRRYWTEQTEAAYEFMFGKILPYPVRECGEGFVSLVDAARSAGLEVLFSTRKHVRGLDRLYFLRQGQIEGFLGAAREMNQRGWVMRVEDGFRTREMQKYLGRTPEVFDALLQRVIWELEGKAPTPEFMFRRCSAMVATVPKFGTHMSGSAIDISVFSRDDSSLEIDRGGPYVEISELTPMDSPFVSAQARENRSAITQVMRRHGFVAYPYEFWHYSSGDAYDQFLRGTGEPAIYGAVDWDMKTDVLTPIANPNAPLNSNDELKGEIEASLREGRPAGRSIGPSRTPWADATAYELRRTRDPGFPLSAIVQNPSKVGRDRWARRVQCSPAGWRARPTSEVKSSNLTVAGEMRWWVNSNWHAVGQAVVPAPDQRSGLHKTSGPVPPSGAISTNRIVTEK